MLEAFYKKQTYHLTPFSNIWSLYLMKRIMVHKHYIHKLIPKLFLHYWKILMLKMKTLTVFEVLFYFLARYTKPDVGHTSLSERSQNH